MASPLGFKSRCQGDGDGRESLLQAENSHHGVLPPARRSGIEGEPEARAEAGLLHTRPKAISFPEQ